MKHWLKLIGRKSLSIFCIASVLAFHAANFSHDQFLGPLKDWWSRLTWCKLALSSSTGDLLSFDFPAFSEPPVQLDAHGKPPVSVRPKLDYANQWLSWSGINLRALVDQSQQRWIDYRYHGKRYYYLRDEIAFQYKDHAPVVANAFNRVTRAVNRAVSDAGATLVIAPMPTKVAINRDRLPAWLPEQALWTPITPYDKTEDPYGVYGAVLRGAPEQTIDAFKLFASYHRAHPGEDLYVPSNHQWSSLGIALTAAAVVNNLRSRGWELAKPKVVRLPDQGDLYDQGMLEILNLPPAFAAFYPQTRLREPNYGLNRVAANDSPGRLFVFGTCYSDRMRNSNGFANVLGRALGRSNVINLSADGGNTIPSFRAFARKYAPFQPTDLVIWEFIERGTFTHGEIQTILRSLYRRKRRHRA